MMKNFICLLMLAASSLSAISQNTEYLRIGDVRNSWSTFPGSIDNVTIMIEPKGLYAECQLMMDFSTRCTSFSPGDSLEIQMGFHLPKEVEVTDLWLWIYNIPERARILDRWTASMIYEGIVNRREDPALFIKNSETFYELRIFPLMTNLPRRIKITYQVPFHSLTNNFSQVVLPMNILKLTHCPIDTLRIAFKETLGFTNPMLMEDAQLNFTTVNDPYFGNCKMAQVSNIGALGALTLRTQNNNNSTQYFAGHYEQGNPGQGLFQLELNMSEIFGVSKSKKAVFLFDFMTASSNLTKQQVLQSFKNHVPSHFGAGDSLNIMFTGLYTNVLSSTWVSADSSSLHQFLNTLDTSLFTNHTNLSTLLIDGIDFIRNNGNEGHIVLISSSTAFTNTSLANNLINSTLNFMGTPLIPIFTISLDDKSYVMWGANNNYYRGNEYLLSNLAYMTGGESQMLLRYIIDNNWWYYNQDAIYTSFENMLMFTLPKLSGYFSAHNIYVGMQSGFTYSNYNTSQQTGFIYYNTPFRVTGKYTGSFPMLVNVSAQTYDGLLHNAQLVINQSDIKSLDSLSGHLWAGQYLRELLTYPQTNIVVNQIIQTSIVERVLTKYTAFLALEPWMTIPDTIAIPGSQSNIIIGMEEAEEVFAEAAFVFNYYPNPVSSRMTFSLEIIEPALVGIDIFNMMGQKAGSIAEENFDSGAHLLYFDFSSLPDGIYFFRLKVNNTVKKHGKIVVVK